MNDLSRFQPCGWGVFWEEDGSVCQKFTLSEGSALDFAARLQIPGASVEPIYRDTQHHT